MNKVLIRGLVVLGLALPVLITALVINRKPKKVIIEDGGVIQIDPIYSNVYKIKKD